MVTNVGSKDKKEDEVANKDENDGKNTVEGKDEGDRKSIGSCDLCETVTVKGNQ